MGLGGWLVVAAVVASIWAIPVVGLVAIFAPVRRLGSEDSDDSGDLAAGGRRHDSTDVWVPPLGIPTKEA